VRSALLGARLPGGAARPFEIARGAAQIVAEIVAEIRSDNGLRSLALSTALINTEAGSGSGSGGTGSGSGSGDGSGDGSGCGCGNNGSGGWTLALG
jgi:hypothetical protein